MVKIFNFALIFRAFVEVMQEIEKFMSKFYKKVELEREARRRAEVGSRA